MEGEKRKETFQMSHTESLTNGISNCFSHDDLNLGMDKQSNIDAPQCPVVLVVYSKKF